jgi:site-specific recombinase XerD
MIEDKFNKIELTSEQLFDLISKYLEQAKVSKNTSKARECALLYFHGYHKRHKSFYFIPDNIKSYREYLIKKSGFSNYTIINYLSSLKGFCDYLALCCVLDKNPVKRIKYDIEKKEIELKYFKYNNILNIIEENKDTKNLDYLAFRNIVLSLLMIFTHSTEKRYTELRLRDLYKKERTYFIKLGNEVLKIDSALNHLLSQYLEVRYQIEGDDYLFITYGKRSKGDKLSIRNLRQIANEFVLNYGFDGSPMRVLKNTMIFYHLKKKPTEKLLTQKFKIENKYIIERYMDEFPNFI